jgi:AcrR family transcriptional regulator
MIDKADFVPATVRTEPVQQRSTERIASLLDAAAALIDEQGIDGLTTSDVATRSGSSVGVVYRYFPNIQSLLRALAARNMEKFTDRIYAAMNDSPAEWLTALDTTIDAYIDLTRTEPGFRAVRFGDIIDERFIQPEMTNNSLLAAKFSEMLVKKYGLVPSDQLSFDLEVIVEISDALLHRAFVYDKQGEEKFIEKLRSIVRELMAQHRALPPAT